MPLARRGAAAAAIAVVLAIGVAAVAAAVRAPAHAAGEHEIAAAPTLRRSASGTRGRHAAIHADLRDHAPGGAGDAPADPDPAIAPPAVRAAHPPRPLDRDARPAARRVGLSATGAPRARAPPRA